MRPIQILLVQHQEDEVEAIKYSLDKLDLFYELSWVKTASEAIFALKEKASRKQVPDLVLIDAELPDKSGRELLSDIRLEKNWRQFSCFLLVAPNNPAGTQPPDLPGLSGYITKPFNMSGATVTGSLHMKIDLLNQRGYHKL